MSQKTGLRMPVLLVLAGGLCLTGCGEQKEARRYEYQLANGKLRMGVDRFSGPAPLTVHYSGKLLRARGPVLYRWRFDDGTTSTEHEPTHSFRKAGYYRVFLDARDSEGQHVSANYLLAAFRPREWKAMQSVRSPWIEGSPLDRIVKVNLARTRKRHAELLGRLHERAR